MLKIEDVKVGDEVECVSSFHVEIKEKDRLEVTDVNERVITFKSIKNGNKYTFNKSYMDCFKKIEKYTFDDLIDYAVQAKKDNEISNLLISDVFIQFSRRGEKYDYDISCLANGINAIKSFYKETFVIECEDDIDRIKKGAKITLLNGNKSKVKRVDDDSTLEVEGWDYFLQFFSLKGATVEQSKC